MEENEHALSPFSGEDTGEQPQAGGSLLVDAPEHPEADPSLSPPAAFDAPRWNADDAWNFGKPATGPSLPRVQRPIALGLVVVLVVSVGAYFFLNRRTPSGGTAFALALSQDKTYRYDVRIGMDGTISAQGQQTPFKMQMDQVIAWHVDSVDSGGTATVAVTVQTRSARFNGAPAPTVPSQTSRIQVARDGRILSTGFEMTGFGSNSDFGSLVPGSDQFMPLLPNHPVKVGESWTKRFDQELPFGMGRFRYDVDSKLLRYENSGGRRMAVLFSTLSVPLDMTIDLKKVLGASGNSAGQLLPAGSNPKMKFGGSMSMQQTAWFDHAQGELDRTSGNATFDMSIDFKDFPQEANPLTGQMHLTGTMSLQVQRLDGSPKLSKKAQNAKAQLDLRDALAAAKVHFTDANTYRGFTPRVANRIEPSLAFNAAAKAKVGQVSIRVATRTVLLLVMRSATGRVFCIAERAGKGISYGMRDAKTGAGCRGGW